MAVRLSRFVIRWTAGEGYRQTQNAGRRLRRRMALPVSTATYGDAPIATSIFSMIYPQLPVYAFFLIFLIYKFSSCFRYEHSTWAIRLFLPDWMPSIAVPPRFSSSRFAETMIDTPPLDDRVLIALEQKSLLAAAKSAF